MGSEGGGTTTENGTSKTAAAVTGGAAAAAASTASPPATSRSERRGAVIRGLVAALVPWEHSRRTQRAALLVLGNVLGNALDEDPEGYSGGVEDAGDESEALSASEACASEMDRALAAWDAGGEGGWGTEDGEEEGAEEEAGASAAKT